MSASPKHTYLPERGDVIWLVFDPRIGHEQSGRRPALVLSPKLFTERTGLAIVCPITSQPKGFPFEVPIDFSQIFGAVLPIHVRSIDVTARKAQFIGRAPNDIVDTVAQYVWLMSGKSETS